MAPGERRNQMADATSEHDPVVFNHIGLCVSDLNRSRAFYENVLAFRYWWEMEAPEEPVSVLLQIPQPVGLKAMYLVRDGLTLELLCYGDALIPPWTERSM